MCFWSLEGILGPLNRCHFHPLVLFTCSSSALLLSVIRGISIGRGLGGQWRAWRGSTMHNSLQLGCQQNNHSTLEMAQHGTSLVLFLFWGKADNDVFGGSNYFFSSYLDEDTVDFSQTLLVQSYHDTISHARHAIFLALPMLHVTDPSTMLL